MTQIKHIRVDRYLNGKQGFLRTETENDCILYYCKIIIL